VRKLPTSPGSFIVNKRFIKLAFGLLFVGLLGVLAVTLYSHWDNPPGPVTEEEMRAMALKINGPASPPPSLQESDINKTIRLAIGSLGLSSDSENQKLGDLILAQLSAAPGLECVDRQSLSMVLKESEMSLTGLVRAKDAIRVGKLLKADWFLLGTISSSEGKDSIVARVVDARTGILKQVGVFNYQKENVTQLSERLAALVRDTREASSAKKAKLYLAFGAFQDFSLNSRQADLPSQLRANLTAAYREDVGTTLLERESVSTLIREVQLDLAGLTEDSNAAPGRMQSAFWLVDGFYQSYETSSLEIEVVLRIHQIFGRTSTVKIRSQPGTQLFRQAKEAIEAEMAKLKAQPAFPTRRSEIREQLENGVELSGLTRLELSWPFGNYYGNYNEREVAHQKRNLEEAIKAFETVLLLDPENHKAKIYLAACFRYPPIHREAEARNYYEELIKSPVQDEWSKEAAEALRDLDRMYSSEVIQNADMDQESLKKAQTRLKADVKEGRNMLTLGSGTMYHAYGMGRFIEAFGNNRQAAVKRLDEFLPELEKEYPDFAPHLLASVLQFQMNTNEPVIKEFERSLTWCSEHSDKVSCAEEYFRSLHSFPYDWCMDHRMYSLASQIMEAKRKYAMKNQSSDFEDSDKVRLAYAYKGMQKWAEAATIFESVHNKPIIMGGGGVWGDAFEPVLPSEEIDHCRKQIGLPPVEDPRIFHLGREQFRFRSSPVFAVEENNMWVACDSQLLNLAFDGKTNFVISLPVSPEVGITDLCQSPSTIYIATAGEGLIEYDRKSRQCRKRTYQDGLLMDDVSCLSLLGDSLWIGFGAMKDGGVGKLETRTGKFSSITPALSLDPHRQTFSGSELDDPPNGPPRHRVTRIAGEAKGNLWIEVKGKGLRVYDVSKDTWQPFQPDQSYPSITKQQQEMAIFHTGGGLIPYYDYAKRNKDKSQVAEGLPDTPVTTVTVHENDLWVGGAGFIAAVDMKQKKVRKICYVQAGHIERLEIASGYVWAQFHHRLFGLPLSKLD
jgi:tetratricopeptide (TPR) repeat protein